MYLRYRNNEEPSHHFRIYKIHIIIFTYLRVATKKCHVIIFAYLICHKNKVSRHEWHICGSHNVKFSWQHLPHQPPLWWPKPTNPKNLTPVMALWCVTHSYPFQNKCTVHLSQEPPITRATNGETSLALTMSHLISATYVFLAKERVDTLPFTTRKETHRTYQELLQPKSSQLPVKHQLMPLQAHVQMASNDRNSEYKLVEIIFPCKGFYVFCIQILYKKKKKIIKKWKSHTLYRNIYFSFTSVFTCMFISSSIFSHLSRVIINLMQLMVFLRLLLVGN